MKTNSRRPSPDELSLDGHRRLIDRVQGQCVEKVLCDQLFWTCQLSGSLSAEQVDKVHAPYRWTIRQVIEHCVDAERIFGYRMLRFAAGDQTPLSGFDENAYAQARFGLGNMAHLVTEFGHLRQANITFLRRIVPAAWNRSGSVDGQTISVRGLAWLTAAHLQHHLEIIENRCEVRVQRSSPMALESQSMHR